MNLLKGEAESTGGIFFQRKIIPTLFSPPKFRNGAEIKVQIEASDFGLRFSVFWRE
jgi:hypothetical protein